MKISPNFFDGVKYISLYDLPNEQVQLFSEWVSTSSFVNPTESHKIGSPDLVHYEDYEYWFDHHYLVEKDRDHLI